MHNIQPGIQLDNDVQTINFGVVGSLSEWDSVIVDVREESGSRLLSGDSRLVGEQLGFTPLGDSYQIGEQYDVELFNQPQPIIDFGTDIDMPWHLSTPALFGFEEFGLQLLSPATTITASSRKKRAW